MSRIPLEEYENRHNNKFPEDKIIVLLKIDNYIYYSTIFGICKKECSFFGRSANSIRSALNKEDYIKNRFKYLFGNKYDYDNLKYDNNLKTIKLPCFKHGIFEQNLNSHLYGAGCPKCSHEIRNKINSENSTGWSKKDWKNASKKSKRFDSFKVYIIKCWNDEEEFYKIGRTFQSIKDRFSSKIKMPYNYDIIKVFNGDIDFIYDLELSLKKQIKKYQYSPTLHFNGNLECYTDISKIINLN